MAFSSTSIKNTDLFQIQDSNSSAVYYGCDQTWYRTKWQRLAGCGPTTAANLFYYHVRSGAAAEGEIIPAKSRCVALMEETWNFVTPGLRGVNTTAMFSGGISAFASAKAMRAEPMALDIPKNRFQRPELSAVSEFLENSLSKDLPVAFLNLDNGDEKRLDSWHWVTVIALDYERDGAAAVKILDEGRIKQIDLALWLQTTSLGGGFVSVTWFDSVL